MADIQQFSSSLGHLKDSDAIKRLFPDLKEEDSCLFFKDTFDWLDDKDFAINYSRSCPLDNTQAQDFNSRIINSSYGEILCGIRFKSGFLNKAFVEIYPSFYLEAHQLESIWQTLQEEFSNFPIKAFRFWSWANNFHEVENVDIDLIYFAGDTSAGKNLLSLKTSTELNFYEKYLTAFQDFGKKQPALAKELELSSEEQLKHCIQQGLCFELHLEEQLIGFIACQKDQFFSKDVAFVCEEFIFPEFQGQSYGFQMQASMMALISNKLPLILGSIHQLNTASQKTAIKCQRQAVLTSYFYHPDFDI